MPNPGDKLSGAGEFVSQKRFLNACLVPASWIYGAGWVVYSEAYRLGVFKQSRLPRGALCVGNICAGGTGKTPTVIYLARLLAGEGFDVVVSTSGYGSEHYEACALAPDGALSPTEWGDESALLRWRLPDVPIIVGRRRAEAAKICNTKFPTAVLVMDDGFQHVQFRPRASLILDPEPTNDWCFPAGPYREPRRYGRQRSEKLVPGDFSLTRSDTTLKNINGEPATVSGDVDLLCAVGSPQSVLAGLAKLGLNIVHSRILADHDPLATEQVMAGLGLERPLVVTAKDFVKLRTLDIQDREIVVADYEVQLEPVEALKTWLKSVFHEHDK